MTKKTTTTATPQSPAAAVAPLAPQPSVPVAPPALLSLFVDGEPVQVARGATVMDACTKAGKEIPHFCYHERLSIAGNCRMCLVEVEGMPKPVASCHWPAAEGMKVNTGSKVATDARKGTMEFLLINHPLDCPICDQGGECTLQDLSLGYGGDRSHYLEAKRAVDDKDIGSKIKTVMTRCIHCTRCIRFATEIAGVEDMGATGRGEQMQVGTYVEQALQSELAGNMIDLCPVGALTNKPYAYKARPWELVEHPSLDVLDVVGSHIRVDSRAGQVMRVLPREADHLNEEWATDAARFSYDALSNNRISTPLVAGIEVGWPQALAAVKVALRDAGKRVAGLADDMHCAEDVLAFRSFVEGLGGKVGLASADAVVEGRGANICHTPFADWDKADAVLMIGCNLRLEAPLLNVRVRRAVRKNRVPVAVVGAACDLTYSHQHLGDSMGALDNAKFMDVLAKAQRPLVIVGQQALARADAAAVIGIASGLADRKGWSGLNVLHGTMGRVTALDMGVAEGKAEIVAEWKSGKVSTLVVYGKGALSSDDIQGGNPTSPRLRGARGTLIYVGTHLDEMARMADIVLPAAAWSEKAGLWANGEGRVQEAAACVLPLLNAKEDWKIWRALSGEVGSVLPFDTLAALRALVAKQNPAYAAAQWGKIAGAKVPALKGKVDGKAAFVEAVGQYYLRLPYLANSVNMLAMQAEVGTAKVKRVA